MPSPSSMILPTLSDFAAEAFDPDRYALLPGDWAVAVADVISSTKLAAQGRDRDVNFVAGAVVAALSAVCATPDQPAACQFGGDGAVAAVPPAKISETRTVLAALADWAQTELNVPLRVGLVPVADLLAAGHEVRAALHDFGNGNVFGQFLGDGVSIAEIWVKGDARWRLTPAPGAIPGLEGLSCRWQPIPPRRGGVMCVIIDPLRPGAEGAALLAALQAEIEAVVPTGAAAPLGDGSTLTPGGLPDAHALEIEARTEPRARRLSRKLRALVGSAVMRLAHLLGGSLGRVDTDFYRRRLAERTDYRKQAGGPRFVLDLSDDEATRIEAILAAAEARGHIRFGTARAKATTLTCMVGDFFADRHVHFVDGDGLGFWRASVELKKKTITS